MIKIVLWLIIAVLALNADHNGETIVRNLEPDVHNVEPEVDLEPFAR